MILTAQLQLVPDEKEQIVSFFAICIAARAKINRMASEAKIYRWLELNNLAYHAIKAEFGLPANIVQSLIRQVATERTRFKGKREIIFNAHAAIPLIGRYIKPISGDCLKINTDSGWLGTSFLCGDSQRHLLAGKWKEGKLSIRDGKIFLYLACEIPDESPLPIADVLGIDLGIVNIATDSTGENHSGETVQDKRRMFAHRRRNLQRKGTRAAKRKLRKLSGKQARFQAHVNHVISKRIVAKAFDTGSKIALEDLKGITSRVKVRSRQKAMLHNWGFFQLRSFIEYKAALRGITVVTVDPRNTSRTCPECGHISKSNRKTQAAFACQSCGFSGPADSIAARNIRARALADAPMVAVP